MSTVSLILKEIVHRKAKFLLSALTDEPTGNLDSDNVEDIIGYFSEYHRGGGAVVVVTHCAFADTFADRVVILNRGRVDNNVKTLGEL